MAVLFEPELVAAGVVLEIADDRTAHVRARQALALAATS